eukprot:CAMPEP_0174826162 /NCGR_PEP_ID=MMETSP1107-20130205/43599_1 /TAXON_ID=36770 /ORGANISM="Paraphysomonas vestita, Strain GFlagA" /LENGTH=378 /DNA_ID=CAMNT_0016058727 /DNA_START=196 /DNA_END=1329 /DNA_ORIENTATION=-
MMSFGGNAKCNKFLAQYGVTSATHSIAQKYNSPAALLYRDRLLALVEGRELPTELPKVQEQSSKTLEQSSDPLPGETESQYIARQRALQEQARERMRQKFGSSSGLSSSGKMQGIGSDPNYNPNSQQNSSTLPIDPTEVANSALSFVNTVWETTSKTVNDAKIAEQVTSTWSSLLSTTSNLAQPQRSTNDSTPNNDPNNDPLASGWSMLSSNAISIWNTATVATSALVTTLTTEQEEDYRFPRPDSNASLPNPPPNNNNNNNNINNSYNSYNNSKSVTEDYSHLPSAPPTPSSATSTSYSPNNFSYTTNTSPNLNNSQSTTSSLLDIDLSPQKNTSPYSAAATTSQSPRPYNTSAPNSSSGSRAKKLEVKNDDDFFAS